MNIIEESEAECITLLDNLLPYLMFLSFVVGYFILTIIKENLSNLKNGKLKKDNSRKSIIFNQEEKDQLFN